MNEEDIKSGIMKENFPMDKLTEQLENNFIKSHTTMNERFINNISKLIVEILDKPFSRTTAMFQIIVNVLIDKEIITEEEAREIFTNENIEDMIKTRKELLESEVK